MAKQNKSTTTRNTAYKIKSKAWKNYTERLKSLSETASKELEDYIRAGHTEEEILDVAYALVTKYGEASSELACQMYEAIAQYSGAEVAAAEAAATATYSETAKSIRGTMKRTTDAAVISSSAGRLVKMASVDTMMKNALRDGAEWAWIPQGDTCAYCIMLASRGWKKASKDAIKNGHADHIHNNCDCTYCVRFDHETTVEGYGNGEEYLEMYEKQKGVDQSIIDDLIEKGYDLNTPKGRLVALRRQHYANNKDYIRAQQNAAYARRSSTHKMASNIVLPEGFGSPTPGRRITEEDLQSFAKKAEAHGVALDPRTGLFGGFENYCGDVSVLDELLEDYANSKHYWGKRNQSMPVILRYKSLDNLDDFAKTNGKIITLNKDLFDDSNYMKKLYDYLTKHGETEDGTYFVSGTTYRSIIYHEVGHRLMAYNSLSYGRMISALGLYDSTLKLDVNSLYDFLLKNLSEYATVYSEGRYCEAISELMSATQSADSDIAEFADFVIKRTFLL